MPPENVQVFIKKYCERLQSEGFTVNNIMDSESLPQAINGVVPDILAYDGKLMRIIAVREEEYSGGSEDLRGLREYAREHQGVSYWEFLILRNMEWRLVENVM